MRSLAACSVRAWPSMSRSDGERALMNARVNAYDVVVLDRDPARVHGDDVCRALSADERITKILMLTAAAEHEPTSSAASRSAPTTT